jgi:SAM-dependent methyltransferase
MSTAGDARGYVTDTTYAERFFRELSPVWLNYVAALHGVPPRPVTQAFTYLELGCGFGTSCVVNAAACPAGDFHAYDINPAHVQGALAHAQALGLTNVQVHAASFEELATRGLPPCDFIVAHGVYSWIDAAGRASLRDIVRASLKPGGLFYLSYNCLPGWAAELPLRRLLVELAASGAGDAAQRAEQALVTLQDLRDTRPRYFASAPAAAAALDAYLRAPGAYLAHEFLNAAWEPFYSIDVATEWAEVGLRYVGSATLADNHETLLVSEATAATINKLAQARQRQLALDFAVDRRFRRDVFLRPTDADAAPVPALQDAIVGQLGPSLARNGVRVPRGELRFQDDFMRDLSALTSARAEPLGTLVEALAGAGRARPEIARNIVFLIAAGTLTPFAQAGPYATTARARRAASAQISAALEHASKRPEGGALPSVRLGSGVALSASEAQAVCATLADAPTAPAAIEGAARAQDDLVPTLLRLGLLV